jgi:hypothetical protein
MFLGRICSMAGHGRVQKVEIATAGGDCSDEVVFH